MSETQTVTVDGKQYTLESLTESARTQIGNIRVVDDEIKKIEQQLAIHKTARATYARALKEELGRIEPH